MTDRKKTLQIVKKLENAENIDIKKTIEKAATAGYLGEEHFYCTVNDENGLTHTVSEILGDIYRPQPLDNLYFDIISKALDHDGIFISLAYCTSGLRVPDSECDEVIEYDDYDLDEDEYEYLEEHSLITSKGIKKFKVYAEEGIAGHERTEDLGLVINIIDNEYKSFFALRSTDRCMSSFRILPLGWEFQKEHPLSLKNPLNQIAIEMIDDCLVLKKD